MHDFMQESLNVADFLSDSIVVIVALLAAGVAQPI